MIASVSPASALTRDPQPEQESWSEGRMQGVCSSSKPRRFADSEGWSGRGTPRSAVSSGYTTSLIPGDEDKDAVERRSSSVLSALYAGSETVRLDVCSGQFLYELQAV